MLKALDLYREEGRERLSARVSPMSVVSRSSSLLLSLAFVSLLWPAQALALEQRVIASYAGPASERSFSSPAVTFARASQRGFMREQNLDIKFS